MITESEKARRIALGRHAGAFLRALVGQKTGIAAMVCRTIADAVAPRQSEPSGAARDLVRAINEGARRGGFPKIEPSAIRGEREARTTTRGGDA